MKKLFTLLFVSLSIVTFAQVKKKPVPKKPTTTKNQYYVVKEKIAKLELQLADVKKEISNYDDIVWKDQKYRTGSFLKLGIDSETQNKFKDSSDVIKQKYIDYYNEKNIKRDSLAERKNIIFNQIGDLEYKLATLPNPEGHWKTYYKGSRKLTVWVENGIEYQYPPKK